MANLPSFGRKATTVTTRKAEVALADFDAGMNLGAPNAPGIGICTSVRNPKLVDWTVLDQNADARAPQTSQHLGGDGLGAGASDNFYPLVAVQGDQNPDGSGGTDNNDPLHFIEATLAAAPGADAGGGVINRTDVTLTIGDRIWGTVTTA